MIATRASSETQAAEGPVIDVAVHARVRARARGGRLRPGADRLLLGRSPTASSSPADVFAHTERLGVLLAHRPGFVSPTVAARKLATLDQFSGGRLAVHVISGGSDTDQRRDGDYCDHDTRYRRTDEYLEVLRAIWTADGPVDHERRVLPLRGRLLGGAARAAAVPADLLRRIVRRGHRRRGQARRHLRALGRAARAVARPHRARARGRGSRQGRSLSFSLSLRAILGETEDAAWEHAHALLEQARARAAGGHRVRREIRERGLEAAARGRRRRRRARRAPVHRDRRGDRCARQHDGAGRNRRAGRRLAHALRRHRRVDDPAARVRPARGCARLRATSSGSCAPRSLAATSWRLSTDRRRRRLRLLLACCMGNALS